MPATVSSADFPPFIRPDSAGGRFAFALSCIFLLLAAMAAPAQAEPTEGPAIPPGLEQPSDPDANPQAAESFLAAGMRVIAEQQAMISNGIISSSEWLDSLFWDRSIEAEAQQTRLRLTLSLFAGEREGIDFDGGAHFRLSMPALSERLQLLISDDGDDETTFAIDPSYNRWPPRERTDKGLMAGLRYFFTQKAKRNTSIKASLRLRDGNPALLLEPRYRQDFVLDRWLLRFTQRFVTYTTGEVQIRTIFNLNRPLPEFGELLFRTHAEGIWFEDRNGYFYHLDFKLLQKLDRRRDLEYAWISEFETRPNHRLENIRLRLTYRQKICWDWLFLEVSPQVAFPRDRDRKPEFGILLLFDIYFGAHEAATH